MCGIAGIVGIERASVSHLDPRIQKSIEYRGKDECGSWSDSQCSLFSSRLSIIDIELGQQPMSDITNRYTIVFNGAIYNYIELRSQYLKRGATFRTQSDTEILLEGYKLFGSAVLSQLNGMFAFAIWDKKERVLFFARDRLGKKPFFWTRWKGGLVFSSSIKTFLSLPGWDKSYSQEGLGYFNFLGGYPNDLTAYQKAKSLPFASFGFFSSNNENIAVTKYWKLDYSQKSKGSAQDLMDEYGELLEDALSIRLRADVNLAMSFSGGTDSGTLAAIAALKLGQKIPCYTLDYHTPQSGSNDYKQADEVRSKLGLEWQFIHYDYKTRIAEELVEAYRYFDQPCHQVAITYGKALYQEMGKIGKVIICGNGADELFTGYNGNDSILKRDILRFYLNLLPKPFWKLFPKKIKVNMEQICFGNQSLLDWVKNDWSLYMKTILGESKVTSSIQSNILTFVQELESFGIRTELDYVMHRDLFVSAAETNFRIPDIVGYDAGVEVRSPFLDYRIVEFAARLPHQYKISNVFRSPKIKYLPKKYYENLVGSNLAWVEKHGMGSNVWFPCEFIRNENLYNLLIKCLSKPTELGFSEDLNDNLNLFKADCSSGNVKGARFAGQIIRQFMLGLWLTLNEV